MDYSKFASSGNDFDKLSKSAANKILQFFENLILIVFRCAGFVQQESSTNTVSKRLLFIKCFQKICVHI